MVTGFVIFAWLGYALMFEGYMLARCGDSGGPNASCDTGFLDVMWPGHWQRSHGSASTSSSGPNMPAGGAGSARQASGG